MPAAPRLGDLVAILSRGFARLGDLRFDQSNFGIATDGTDVSLYWQCCKCGCKDVRLRQ
jgi:hypothetical protein